MLERLNTNDVIVDLAVIFRPALLSHPSHELSPQAHQLSQDVLEFLIEHQDWFMLDITPPSSARSGAELPRVEPVDMMINSDDASSWALIDHEDQNERRIVRRRTTSERPGGKSVSQRTSVLRKRRRVR